MGNSRGIGGTANMNMIKRFVRLTAAKYSELITGTKVDEDA